VDTRSDEESGMKLSNAARILAVALAAYIVCDILLTPPAGLETRPVAKVTGLGFATLGLLFAGLALAIVALVLLFRSSRRSPVVAIVAAVLYFPAFLAQQAGLFSGVRPRPESNGLKSYKPSSPSSQSASPFGCSEWALRGLRTADGVAAQHALRIILCFQARNQNAEGEGFEPPKACTLVVFKPRPPFDACC
jgi:hypothetical protein